LRPAIFICRLRRERGPALPLEMLRISAGHPVAHSNFKLKINVFLIWNWNDIIGSWQRPLAELCGGRNLLTIFDLFAIL
jgi:hypothetical protein